MVEATNPVLRAIDLHSGSVGEFARALGVSRQTVHTWVQQRYIRDTGHAYAVERLLRGRVTMQDLHRPTRWEVAA